MKMWAFYHLLVFLPLKILNLMLTSLVFNIYLVVLKDTQVS